MRPFFVHLLMSRASLHVQLNLSKTLKVLFSLGIPALPENMSREESLQFVFIPVD